MFVAKRGRWNMSIVVIVLELVLSFTAAVCGLYAVAVLLERKSRFASKALIAAVIAIVLAVVALICTLFFPKTQGLTDDPQTPTSDGAGEANPTTSTTVPTASTTRMPTKTSTVNNISNMLVNIPAEHDIAKDSLVQLQELCSAYNGKISFYYIDLESGYEIEYRADRAYQAASVIKAPYIKYLLASGVDGSQKLTMAASDKQGGSGVIDKEPAGTVFTVDQLMEYAIRYSDNTAYYMLNKKFGFSGFNQYAKELGITANANSNCVLGYPRPRFGYLSARDIGLYMEDIAKYIATGSEAAKRLKTWMMSTSEECQLTDAFSDKNVLYGKSGGAIVEGDSTQAIDLYHDVAHKYGDTKNIEWAFHDGAIVYADQPFVLAVATSLEPFSEESIEVFHEIAFQINKIHYAYHAK